MFPTHLQRIKVYGTVVSIKDDTYWYLACKNCCTKVIQNHFVDSRICSKCGCNDSQLRYRLCLEIDSKFGLLIFTVFGECLNKYFGKDCESFYRDVLSSGSLDVVMPYLRKSVETSFVAYSFVFTLKEHQQSNKVDVLLQNHTELIAEGIERFGLGVNLHTVFEDFCVLYHNLACAMDSDNDASFLDSVSNNLNCVDNEYYKTKTNQLNNITILPDQNLTKVKLKRSLSDSFAFLQDSLIVSLFQTKKCHLNENSASFTSKHSQSLAASINQNNWDESSSCFSPMLARKNIDTIIDMTSTSEKKENNDTGLPQSENIDRNLSASTTCDILDDVTLPVLNDSYTERLKQHSTTRNFAAAPLTSEGMPMLRRCNSYSKDGRKSNFDHLNTNCFLKRKRLFSFKSVCSNFLSVDVGDEANELKQAQENICSADCKILNNLSKIEGTPHVNFPVFSHNHCKDEEDKNRKKVGSKVSLPLISSTPKPVNTARKTCFHSKIPFSCCSSTPAKKLPRLEYCTSPDLFVPSRDVIENNSLDIQSPITSQINFETNSKLRNSFDCSNDMFL